MSGSADVEANWDAIKATEQPARTVTGGVPLALPALTLAAKLQSRGAKAGVWAPPQDPAADMTAAAAEAAAVPDEAGIGALLLAAVTLARANGVDAEAALRRQALALRDSLES